MNPLSILYTLIISPLELCFEIVFVIVNRIIQNPGLSIIALSLAINFLVLPLYRRADRIQQEEREIEEKLDRGVRHIKETFSGDERFLMLSTYYRQNGYKPYYVLKSSLSLLLQIPFFIAAYRFLSELELLKGASFGPIADLGSPDGMIRIGALSINLLPILMTLINVISGMIYTKGMSLRNKVQLYGVAALFLVLLYNSPSGLVFYWTLNNLFSLVKNLFCKLPDPGRILKILSCAFGLFLALFFIINGSFSLRSRVLFTGAGLLLMLPFLWIFLGKLPIVKKLSARINADKTGAFGGEKTHTSLFFTSALFAAILVGFLIPSAVVRSSPAEFVDTVTPFNPVQYVISSGCLALGLFVVWLGVYYYLSTEKVRAVFAGALLLLSLIFTTDYLFFGTDLGLISRTLRFDEQPDFSRSQMLVNLAVCAAVFVIGLLLCLKGKKIAGALITAGVLTLLIMTAVNFTGITREYRTSKESIEKNAAATIRLSKNGQNVVVLMLDKMISYYLPFIFEEKPELYEQFEGFTYYPNSVSYATKTNVATPGLYGGYEYRPEKINERADEPLYKKQNEALRVMPVLFSENGFDVTVTDPIYANYQEYADLSIYSDHPEISAYALMGHVSSDTFAQGDLRSVLNRNFFCYGLMKVMPLFLQTSVYNYGNYNAVASYQENEITGQNLETVSKATGLDPIFMSSYNVLENLPKITDCDGSEENTFLMFYNKTTHDTMMLQEPEYEPRMAVDNTEYDRDHHVKTDKNGRTIDLNPDGSDYFGGSYTRTVFYQINAAALLKLGQWFDYLRENGVYDNTRIILVSDHSWNVKIEPDMVMVEKMETGEDKGYDLLHFNCVLMVKDFGSEGEMVTDDTFMTNCDVPLLATKDLINDPVNPFTGNPLTDTPKHTEKLQLCYVEHWMVSENNGNTYMPENWFSVHDNIFEKKNWEFLGYY